MSWYKALLGKYGNWVDELALPAKPLQRSEHEQASVNRLAASLTLYDLKNCPYCHRVRKHLKQLNVDVQEKNLKRCHIYQKELLSGGGRAQVPCLKIEKKSGTKWLYESSDIIRYLDEKFAPKHQRLKESA